MRVEIRRGRVHAPRSIAQGLVIGVQWGNGDRKGWLLGDFVGCPTPFSIVSLPMYLFGADETTTHEVMGSRVSVLLFTLQSVTCNLTTHEVIGPRATSLTDYTRATMHERPAPPARHPPTRHHSVVHATTDYTHATMHVAPQCRHVDGMRLEAHRPTGYLGRAWR